MGKAVVRPTTLARATRRVRYGSRAGVWEMAEDSGSNLVRVAGTRVLPKRRRRRQLWKAMGKARWWSLRIPMDGMCFVRVLSSLHFYLSFVFF